jgi:protein TonB
MQGQDSSRLADAGQFAFDFSQEAAGRCGSCGGPSSRPDGDLCDSCQQAFSSVLGHGRSTPVETVVAPQAAAVEAFADAMSAAVPGSLPPVEAVPPPQVVEAMAALPESAAAAVPTGTGAAAPAQAPAMDAPAIDAPALATTESAVAAVEPVVTGAQASSNVVAVAPTATTTPAAVAATPKRSGGLRAEVVAAAAVLVIAVVGVPTGALWLQRQVSARKVAALGTDASEPVVQNASLARAVTPPKPQVQPEPAAVQPEPRPQAQAPAATPRPAPVPRTVSRTARVVKAPAKVAQPAPVAKPVAVAPLATLPAAAVVAPAPAPSLQPQLAVPETPTGKFFDLHEVDVTPRIASRVDPRLPGNLVGRPGNDVVVVRILVSQSGHAFRVNLLRRSRLGPSVDEAVLAAVKQWTFTPARKNGEAVSCWFNVGVSLTAN